MDNLHKILNIWGNKFNTYRTIGGISRDTGLSIDEVSNIVLKNFYLFRVISNKDSSTLIISQQRYEEKYGIN